MPKGHPPSEGGRDGRAEHTGVDREILDPVSPELEAALTRTEWELTDDVVGQGWRYNGMVRPRRTWRGRG